MDDLLRDFLTETSENLATLDHEIVRLEQNPNDPHLIGSIFRLVHTIKGTCGFLGLPRLEQLAHAGENVLGKFRDRELDVTADAVDLILKSIDRIKFLLGYLEHYEKESDQGDEEALIAALNAMADGKTQAVVLPSSAPKADEFGFVPVMADDLAALDANMKSAAALSVSAPPAIAQAAASTAASPAGEDFDKGGTGGGASIADQSIRVNVAQLEALMTTVSELVLTRNQLLQILRGQKDSAFTAPLQRLNQVASELQDGVMKTRMQPIGNAWAKLPRIVRDVAHELNKKIDLEMVGAETEIDRQVLDLIKDPLTHMVRNSADHGIELPADRIKIGKPETGIITLKAYHEGGHIIIDIIDDGKGLALEKIKTKILEKAWATESEVAAMSDRQIMQFIFKAGFSTAARVTSVSGRGVGMDVVRANIERIGGTVDFTSVEGRGASFSIKIPLTLAIVSALIVDCGGKRFAVPQLSVVELVRTSSNSEHRIEFIHETPLLRLRHHVLPLVSLRKILRLGDDTINANGDAFIVVAQVGSSRFGIIVDRVFDTEEIVVKPVAKILQNIALFSGNTILGDGSVIMILDMNALVGYAGDISSPHHVQQVTPSFRGARGDDRQSLLLFRAGAGARKAVPLALIARLEEIDRATIEYSEGNAMVQYRGRLMPLVAAAPDAPLPTKGKQPVLVFADKDKHMGLMVDDIIDIVEDHLSVDITGHRPGVLGTSIIAGQATDIVDTVYYLSQTLQNWFEEETAFEDHSLRRVLLVEDSPFFRNLLTPLLTVAGYDVTSVEDPMQALKLMEEGVMFDAIVSDIEMPHMNGFDFVATLRNQKTTWSKLPIFAMSSHATPRDFERGRQAGFTDYVPKFNREGLIKALHENLSGDMT